MKIYVVQPGDTIDAIADSFQVPVQTLIYDNQLVAPYELAIGQSLLIQVRHRRTCREARSEGAFLCAPLRFAGGRAFSRGLSPAAETNLLPAAQRSAHLKRGTPQLKVENILTEPDPGQGTPLRTPLISFGYAYPFISPWVLEQTLPFLSALHVFSYGFTQEGILVPPPQDDRWMIDLAVSYDVLPVLTLTPLGADGLFDNRLITSVVQNACYKETLIRQLILTLEQKKYGGVDVDFEYIPASDRDAFTDFLSDLAAALHPLGYRLSVALAPKTSADQTGLLYEGKDYAAIGAIADSVLLMTYEWGYKYGPNMAVAPLNKVRQVVEYAVTEISPKKICLGIPNYGYDWPLPFVEGTTAAVTIGNVEAVRIAIRYSAVIRFDETAQSPFFHYLTSENIRHEVWFEDVQSILEKLRLIRSYGLGGAGYWQLMRWWRANWLLLQDQFRITGISASHAESPVND